MQQIKFHLRESEKLKVKPKGRYLKMIYLGKYNPDKFYEEAKNYAKENNLKLKGVSYESEVSIFMGYEFENYMVEISMEIEQMQKNNNKYVNIFM